MQYLGGVLLHALLQLASFCGQLCESGLPIRAQLLQPGGLTRELCEAARGIAPLRLLAVQHALQVDGLHAAGCETGGGQ